MLNEEIKQKMTEKLTVEAGKDSAYQRIGEFMVWAVSRGNHADIAAEIISGTKSIGKAHEAAAEKAEELANGKKSIMLEDAQVYAFVAEYLGLQGCTPAEAIAEYCFGNTSGSGKEKAPEPTKNSASLDLGLDSLFDD